MNSFTIIWRWLRSFGQTKAMKQEIDEELRFHLEQRTAENIAAGLSPEDAAREARKRFGNVQSIREECRERRGANFGETLIQDARFGLRMLRKNPGFTTVAVLTLALGIGANTSMFSLLNLLLFQRGPYPHPDRLVRIFRTSPQSQAWPHSAADLLDYQEQNKSFEGIGFYEWAGFNLAEPGEPAEHLSGVFANADLFRVLGVQPTIGRLFGGRDDHDDNRVVVLGDNCWRRQFCADTNIVGRRVRLDGESLTVVGVMPTGFDYPLLWGKVDIWRPLNLAPQQRQDRGSHFLHAMGRLKPGVSRSRGEAELKAICARLPNTGHDNLRLVPLLRSGYSEIGQRMIYYTFGLAGFVLLIACVNLANLQLARAFGRGREFAVRAALGAGRGRLLRQSLTESLMISIIGGLLGLLLAVSCNGFLSRHIPYVGEPVDVPMDFRVFGFAFATAVLTGVLFGIAPALLGARSDLREALQEGRRTAGARGHTTLRKALIAGELALALTVLAGAGLFIRRLEVLTQIKPGWQVDGLVSGQLVLNAAKYTGPQGRQTAEVFFQQLEERLGALPGIAGVAFSWSLPVWGFKSSGGVTIAGQPRPKPGEMPLSYKESVSPGYFHTLGIRIQQGRAFTPDDTDGKLRVAVINESMARRFWPGANPAGKRIDCDGDTEIIGVVNDVGFPASPGQSDTPFQIYRPLAQVPGRFLFVSVRTTRATGSVAADLRREVAALDPDLAVQDIQSARNQVEVGLSNLTTTSWLLAAFAVLGLALAALGMFGVTSYTVAQRTGEIGIRIALGAQQQHVLWLVLRQGILLCAIGTALGLIGAAVIAQLLASLLPELSASDPLALAIVTAVLVAAALTACFLPARRATRIDPMTALRCE